MEPLSEILRIRKRPGTYLNVVEDGTGLHNLGLGIAEAAVAAFIDGGSDQIAVRLSRGGTATIWWSSHRGPGAAELARIANGRRQAAQSMRESVLDEDVSAVIGASTLPSLLVVNADLSDRLVDQVWSGSEVYFQSYVDGHTEFLAGPEPAFERLGEVFHGVEVSFTPSPRTFGAQAFDADRLSKLLASLAERNGCVIGFEDAR